VAVAGLGLASTEGRAVCMDRLRRAPLKTLQTNFHRSTEESVYVIPDEPSRCTALAREVKHMSYYNLALYLATALVATQLVGLLYVASVSFDAAKGVVPGGVLALAILFGVWGLSNAARYLGAIWLLILAGVFIWYLFKIGKVVLLAPFVWGLVLVVISLALCWLLLLSKQFEHEFAERRLTELRSKRILRNVALGLVLVAITASAISMASSD